MVDEVDAPGADVKPTDSDRPTPEVEAPYDPSPALTGFDAWTLARLNQLDPTTRNRLLHAHR